LQALRQKLRIWFAAIGKKFLGSSEKGKQTEGGFFKLTYAKKINIIKWLCVFWPSGEGSVSYQGGSRVDKSNRSCGLD
jgi:hypothetical protein